MKFIHFITVITLSVKFGAASPLTQLIENEDQILAKDIISISSDSKSSSSESSSDESHENKTIELLLSKTRLFPINASAIEQAPFLEDELRENFETENSTEKIKIESFGIRSAFNLPWFADLTFHLPNKTEEKVWDDINITVSGELFQSNEENETTTLSFETQEKNDLAQTKIKISTTTVIVTPSPPSTTTTTTTKKKNNPNATSVVSTTESIKEILIEKIAEIAAEPIILTQGVR